MLVIKIELWPFGNEKTKRELGRAHIINDGTGSLEIGNYVVKLFKSAEYSKNNAGKVYKTGEVKEFKRLKGSPWELLKLALINVLDKKKIRNSTSKQHTLE